jgi:hypothetical protein
MDGKRVFKRYVYKEVEPLNIEPNSDQRVLKRVVLELNQCRYPYNKNKYNKSGNKVKRHAQESVLLSCLAPTTISKDKSTTIINEYKLSCIIKIEGATSSQYPRFSMPITILPLPVQPPKFNEQEGCVCLDDDF